MEEINVDGQTFERVSRILASTKVNKMKIELDVNTDIYPMQKGQFYKFCLATSVNADGSDTFDVIRYENQEQEQSGGEKYGSLVDQYEYVCHGKIFKYQLDETDKEKKMMTLYLSFGGLLMSISGEYKNLKSLEIDSRVYLLLSAI